MPVAFHREAALLQVAALFVCIGVGIAVLVPAWNSSDREPYWTISLIVAYAMIAYTVIITARLTERLLSKPHEALWVRKGELVFLDVLIWRQKIRDIQSVAIGNAQSKPLSLEIALKGGGVRRIPLGLLAGGPAAIRAKVAKLLESE